MKQDLSEFLLHVKRQGIVDHKILPYFEFWLTYYQRSDCLSDVEFSEYLSDDGRKDWQVRQALDALKLYRDFLGIRNRAPILRSPLEEMEDKLKVRHCFRKTVKSYLYWCKGYLEYCRIWSRLEKDSLSFCDFLTNLALKRKVASSTQNQAFSAILFLFRNVWDIEPSGGDAVRARKPKRLPVAGKGDKDRLTILSKSIVSEIKSLIAQSRRLFETSAVSVTLPDAIASKYPGAGRNWLW